MTKKQGKSGRKIKGKEMKTAATYTVSRTALITQKEEGKEKFKKDRKRKSRDDVSDTKKLPKDIFGGERDKFHSHKTFSFFVGVYIFVSQRESSKEKK